MVEIIPSTGDVPPLVRLVGNVDVREAVELHNVLTQALSQEKGAVIDCTTLESMDTSCMQLLLAAKRSSQFPVNIEIDGESEPAIWIRSAGLAEAVLA
ncbi:MAG: STAS domain-containing protein [Pirellulaceae bacterium]|nr:STAS domain-containing protein [Planctomycetales bacterium]